MIWSSFPQSSLRLRIIVVALMATALASSAYGQTKPKTKNAEDANAPTTTLADQIVGRADRVVDLDRDIEVVHGETKVNADHATYDNVEDEIDATGHVVIRRSGDTYTGEHLHLKLDSGTGSILNPEYKIDLNNGQGKAERVEFENEYQSTAFNGTYSTCEGPNPDWYLRANTLQIDTGRDVGTASGTTLYFQGVPILPTAPGMSFPISGARKSGWLPPTVGATSKGGFEFALPYYFNIAPNRDLTVTPKVIAKRGAQMAFDGRYLGNDYFGETTIEYLPDDQVTGTNRYAISSKHTQTILPGWSYGWNVKGDSDYLYPSNFTNSIIASSERQLARELRTDYGAQFWNVSARVLSYQVWQDPASATDSSLLISRPYSLLPQLNLHAGRYDVHGFDWSLDSEFTRFWHPTLVRGTRMVINPQLSYPITAQGYYLTPKVSVNASSYELENPSSGQPANLHRTVPTFSLDSGLVYERDAKFMGEAMTQTLEPRLFYLYTPYRDQSLFPNFDSALATFNYAQMFSENRFVGSDRIGDANQITAAVTSRFIESNGAERLRLTIGQRFYITPPKVLLDSSSTSTTGHPDLMVSASGRINKNWGVESTVEYSESERKIYSSNYGVQWQPAAKHVLNLEYRTLDDGTTDSFKQVDLSGQWPIGNRWYGVSRISRSLLDHRIVDGLLGAEYNADCWVLRLVAQRYAATTSTSSSSFFIQLELNGLSRLGSNPLDALSKGISGYQKLNANP